MYLALKALGIVS